MKMKLEQDHERKEGVSQEQSKIVEIVDMIERISDPKLLDRIYRFIKYIYIHKA